MNQRNRLHPFQNFKEMTLTPDEQSRLISACDRLSDRLIFSLALTQGIRREDFSRIEKRDVVGAEDRLEIRVPMEFGRQLRKISPAMAELILEYLKVCPEDSDRLIPFEPRVLWDHLQKACSRASILPPQGRKNRPMFSLRVSAAHNWYRQGVPPSEVARRLGISEAAAILYYHPETTLFRQQVVRLDGRVQT